MSNIIEVVQDALEIRNVAPHVLEKVPRLVRRAVVDLQNDEILPPSKLEFTSINEKKQKLNEEGEVIYEYYQLPEDYKRLDEFYVDGTAPYQYTYYENYIDVTSSKKSINYFTITDEYVDEDIGSEKRLICSPFPKDNKRIIIKYFLDGSKTKLSSLNEKHWEVIITKVESLIGVVSRDEATDKAGEISSNWKQQQGNKPINQAYGKTKPKFFGKF